jgi:hypothetical protein
MTGPRRLVGAVALFVLVAACTVAPPMRMDSYLGPDVATGKTGVTEHRRLSPIPGDVGLLVINDTTSPGSAPALSQEAFSFLVERITQQVGRNLPLKVTKVFLPDGVSPTGGRQALLRLTAQEAIEYLVVAVVSSAESESPVQLSLGGPESVSVSGTQIKNFALVELALVEGKTSEVLVRSHGRAWASLDRLAASGRSHQYPVIRRSSRMAPIFPKAEQAPDLLRALAGDEALEQAVMHFEEAWAGVSAGPSPKS